MIENEIPIGWKLKHLSDLATYVNGASFKPSDWQKEGLPIIRIQNLNGSIVYNYYKGNIKSQYLVFKNDLLFAWSATIDVFIWKEGKAILNQHIFKVTPAKGINKFFLYYAIKHFLNKFIKVSHGTTMKHFKVNELSIQKIPVPNLHEQEKIASVLSVVDDLIQKTRIVIAKTYNLKKGLIESLYKDGIKLIQNYPHSTKGENKLNNSWKVAKIGSIAKIVRGGTPSTSIEKFWKGEIIWVTPTEIKKISGGKITNSRRKITNIGLKKSSAQIVPKKSVILCTRATIGELATTTKDTSFNQGCTGIIPTEKVNFQFLAYYLPKLKNKMISLSTGTTFLELSKQNIEHLLIPIPSIQKQERIVSVLLSVDEVIINFKKEHSKTQRLKTSLMQNLLSGKLRVIDKI